LVVFVGAGEVEVEFVAGGFGFDVVDEGAEFV
jgi:hypothetical protein